MDNPRHREAEALLIRQGGRLRSEYVVNSILTAHQAEHLEQTIRHVVRDELKNLRLSPQSTQQEKADTAVDIVDLPDCLIHALEEL